MDLQGELRNFLIQRKLWEQELPHSQDVLDEEEQDEDADIDRGVPFFLKKDLEQDTHLTRLKS